MDNSRQSEICAPVYRVYLFIVGFPVADTCVESYSMTDDSATNCTNYHPRFFRGNSCNSWQKNQCRYNFDNKILKTKKQKFYYEIKCSCSRRWLWRS